MKFKGTVSSEFIERRNEIVKKDRRPVEVAERQWDFEFPEYHQCLIPSTGHRIYSGYEYDTEHDFFGNCDFKYLNKRNEIHISHYILKQLEEGKIDHIIPWSYISKNWSRSLEEGDTVQYEILDHIPPSEILSSMNVEHAVRGITFKH